MDNLRCSRYESGMSEVIARLDGIVLAKTERAAAKQAGVAGVPDESFDAFANDLGLPLPPPFRELYAWHGGDTLNSFVWTLGGDDDGWFLEPLTSILATRRLWQERAAALRDASADDAPTLFNAGFWHPSFVPFMSDRSATELVVATAPCFGGPAGQIVSFDYKGGSWWRVLSSSLEVFLETMAELMETNASFYSLDEIQKARFPEYRIVELEASMLRDPSRFDGPPPRPLRVISGALVGRRGVVVRGAFQGFEGTVVDESSTGLTVIVHVFGREVPAVVPHEDFDAKEPGR